MSSSTVPVTRPVVIAATNRANAAAPSHAGAPYPSTIATPSQSLATPSVSAMASTMTPIMRVRGSVQALSAWLGRASLGVRLDGQEPAHGGGTEQRDEHGDRPDVPADAQADERHEGADGRAGDRAQAERGVEARHDRAAQQPLDLGALDVHRHVPGAGAQPDQEQADRRDRHRLQHADADGDQQQPGRLEQRGPDHHAAGAEPLHGPTGRGQRDDRPDRHRQQQQPELRRARGRARAGPTGCATPRWRTRSR